MIVKMWRVQGMKLLTCFLISTGKHCEILSEMDIRTRDTVNSRIADTLLLRAPRH